MMTNDEMPPFFLLNESNSYILTGKLRSSDNAGMRFFKRQRDDKENDAALISEAKRDETVLNQLIADNQSFILACASKATHRYVTISDDEYSIALIAFNEAVKTYESTKGPFKPFAAMVIRRRILDLFDKESAHSAELSVEPQMMDGVEENTGEIPLVTEIRTKTVEAIEAKDDGLTYAQEEINEVQTILRDYGFSFFDLTDASPKSEKTRNACALAVKAMLEHPELMAEMRRTKGLPAKKLLDLIDVKPKILERHRRYIIAACEILDGDYPVLGSFLVTIRKAVRS